MRGGGAAIIGFAAILITGAIFLFLKIFRIEHKLDFEDVSGIVAGVLITLPWFGVILYCIGIALGICSPLNQGGFNCHL
jgi:4-amino-4-deoxy-L-arabinose transferase-like glycosyltransferase